MTIKPARFATTILSVILFAAPAAFSQVPGGAGGGAPAFTPQEEADARALLGERFYDLSLSFAEATRLSDASIRESAALIEAATKMNPYEPRFLRLLAIMRESAKDIDGAIDAWTKYRDLPIESAQTDEIAQISLIDLYLARMQSNEVKLKYLNAILERKTFGPRVKAHMAVMAAQLLDQRSRTEAVAMLATARKNYPLPEVTQLELDWLPVDATPPQRMRALLNVLHANPTRADAIDEVANMLAAAGLSEESLSWYAVLVEVYASRGMEMSERTVINFLTERYRAGEMTYAGDQLDALLKRQPDDLNLWNLRLTIARTDESPQLLKQGRQAFLRRVNATCSAILAGSSPATQPAGAGADSAPRAAAPGDSAPAAPPTATAPADEPEPPLADALARAKASTDPRFKTALFDSLAAWAWFEVYFNHSAPSALPIINALKELSPTDEADPRRIVARRLAGWLELVSANGDKTRLQNARDLLSTQKDVDPLSALGLMRVEDQQGRSVEAAKIGVKLASQPHEGVIGAIIWEATKGRGFKPTTQPADTVGIKAELDKFPKDWLQVARNPSRFYAIRAEPIIVGHPLGDPLIAEITIENRCLIDLTIGDFGLIKPWVIFDAQVQQPHLKSFPGIMQERLMGRQVLGPGESMTQVVRIDHGELSDILCTQPGTLLVLSADVITNPVAEGRIYRAQAGGYAKNFGRMFVRTEKPLANDNDRRKFYESMAGASPAQKMLDIDLLAAYIRQFVRPSAAKGEKDLAEQFANMIDKCRSDPAPGVKLWASYTMANLLTGTEAQKAVGDMLTSDRWDRRMLGLVAARRNLPPEITRDLAIRQAATDADPLVKGYAAAIAEQLQSPGTQPATIPPAK